MKTNRTPLTRRAVQTTSHLLMVRPVRFGFNAQTATDNAFQSRSPLSAAEVHAKAQTEFDTFVELLRANGITVTVFQDLEEPHTPDSIFPNNWISFHESGKIVIYPMFAPNRRLERRSDIVAHFQALYEHATVVDFTHYEEEGMFLEGTGSMIMDRENQVIYACHSHRTTRELFELFCREVEAEGMLFHATDRNGQEIYHTNVMMALGTRFAVVCMDAIRDEGEKAAIKNRLEATGHEVVSINFDQVESFAGNMLQLYNSEGTPILVMSQRAHDSLFPEQLEKLASYSRILTIPLDIIESSGGGSVRCMMAEVFLGDNSQLSSSKGKI